jgi:multiple sugar transport system permease protein
MRVLPQATAADWRTDRNWLAIGFITPAVALVVVVSLYPVADAFDLSLHATQFANRLDFIGEQNYTALLRDQTIWRDAVNSLIYTIGSLILVIPYSMGVALMLNRPSPWRGLFRTVVILPWVVSQTITALLWGWLLNADFGPITYAIQAIIGEKLSLLSSPMSAMGALILVNVWASYPLGTLLFLAALQTIPKELYEAARVDGASPFAQFWYVTIPMVRSTILVVVIQFTLQYFNMVTLIYVLTGGGPLSTTQTLALRVLKMSFEEWDLGRGAALGLMLTLINLAFSLLYTRALKGSGK